jgi:hypothetical protein
MHICLLEYSHELWTKFDRFTDFMYDGSHMTDDVFAVLILTCALITIIVYVRAHLQIMHCSEPVKSNKKWVTRCFELFVKYI